MLLAKGAIQGFNEIVCYTDARICSQNQSLLSATLRDGRLITILAPIH